MSRILVTGGAGFIGAHLVKKLIEKKHQVLIFDNLKTIGGIKYIHPNSKFIKGDLTNRKDILKIIKWKPKIVFHLAAQSGGESAYDNPKYDYLTNGLGTLELCKLAKKINVEHFIYTSTVAVYGSNLKKKIDENTEIKPDSIYGVSKYAGELFINQIFRNTNIKTTIFRVFNIYGPGENLDYMKKGMVSIYSNFVRLNKPINVKGSLKRVRDITYIDDCVEILVRSIKNKSLKKNEVINLSSSQEITVGKLINEILKVSAKNLKIVTSKGTPGDSFRFHSSNKKIKKIFKNFRFTTLRNGLTKYFMWINSIPKKTNLKNFHPFEKDINK